MRMLWLMGAMLVVAGGCATGSGGAPGAFDGHIEDSKIWFREYAANGATVGGTRRKDTKLVYVNESNTEYVGMESSQLKPEEFMFEDEQMYAILMALRELGLFDPANGAIAINGDPEAWVAGQRRKPAAWLAVRYGNKTTLALSYPDETDRKRIDFFTNLALHVQFVIAKALPKDLSAGTRAEDLERWKERRSSGLR